MLPVTFRIMECLEQCCVERMRNISSTSHYVIIFNRKQSKSVKNTLNMFSIVKVMNEIASCAWSKIHCNIFEEVYCDSSFPYKCFFCFWLNIIKFCASYLKIHCIIKYKLQSHDELNSFERWQNQLKMPFNYMHR